MTLRGGFRFRLIFFAMLLLILGIVVLWRLQAGDMRISPAAVAEILFSSSPEATPQEILVVRSIRFPRLFASLAAGASLAVSGAVLQGVLGNPLADPYTLGIASGAALGASMGIHLGGIWVSGAAFAGALAALGLAFLLSWRARGASSISMVLSGIVVSSILSAGVTLFKALSDERVSAIVLWLMGSFSGASVESAAAVFCGAVLLFAAAEWWGRELDAMSLGEGRAFFLGVREKRIKITLLVLASLAAALPAASFGIIGFVGLVGPHLVRLVLGPSHRPLLAASFLGGALLLAGADGAARALGELPVGVITALAGGPVFCWILVRQRGGDP